MAKEGPFLSSDRGLLRMALTIELDIDRVRVNQYAKCQG